MRGGRNKFGTYYKQDRATRMKQYQERNNTDSLNNGMSSPSNSYTNGQYSPENNTTNSRKRTPVAVEVTSR